MVERIGAVAYKLLLPPSTKIHSIFHISQLKICHGNHTQSYVPLPLTVNEKSPVIQSLDILHTRVILRGQQHIQQLLIQWEGLDESKATWEAKDDFLAAYPFFNLEDNVVFKEGRIVMDEKEVRPKGGAECRRITCVKWASSKLLGFES